MWEAATHQNALYAVLPFIRAFFFAWRISCSLQGLQFFFLEILLSYLEVLKAFGVRTFLHVYYGALHLSNWFTALIIISAFSIYNTTYLHLFPLLFENDEADAEKDFAFKFKWYSNKGNDFRKRLTKLFYEILHSAWVMYGIALIKFSIHARNVSVLEESANNVLRYKILKNANE